MHSLEVRFIADENCVKLRFKKVIYQTEAKRRKNNCSRTGTPTPTTDKTDNNGTPTPITDKTDNNGTPTANTGKTDKTDQTDTSTTKNNNVVKPSSSLTVADLINKIQPDLDDLRKALNVPNPR